MISRPLVLSLILAACSDSPSDGGLATEDYLALAAHPHAALYRLDGLAPGAADRLTGGCAPAAGPEHAYRFVAPADGIAHAVLRGDAPVVYARTRLTEPDDELACSADVDPFSRGAEIYFAITAGQTYYVVADAAGAPGDQRLDLELRPAFTATGLAGKYRSRGYGLLLAFSGDQFVLREETSISCTTLLGGPLAQLAAAVDDVARGVDGTLVIRPQLSAGDLVFDPIAEAPAICKGAGTPVIGDPGYQRDARAVLDVLAATFREHYAFFALRGVDWEREVAAARAGLTADTDDAALFERLAGLIAPLGDGHVSLSAGDTTFEVKPQEVATILTAEHEALGLPGEVDAYIHDQLARIRAVADAALIGPPGEIRRYERNLVAGRLAADVGYLRLDNFVVVRAEQPLYLAALDAALAGIADTRRLVVDLRLDGGGSDAVAIAVANRLARRPGVFARKQARAGDGVTAANDLVVAPVATAYRGEIIVLIDGSTASAGETLVLALRGQPGVTIAGWPTSGEFSDVLERQLPNGWSFGLSNEIYRDAAGALYEATGIPPDVAFPGEPFPRADRLDGVDRVLARAAQLTR